MIKCFVVKYDKPLSKYIITGRYTLGCYYLAKITNSSPNTISILDDNDNWVPFDYQRIYLNIWSQPRWENYFSIETLFFVENKKELNKITYDKSNRQRKLIVVIKEALIPWLVHDWLTEGKDRKAVYYRFK